MLEYLIAFIIFLYFYIKKINKARQERKKILNILITSDIHLSFEYVEQLKKWIKKNNKKFDLILNPGDFCNLDENQVYGNDTGYQALLDRLRTISKNVLYIPGNHDTRMLYDSIPQDVENPDEWEPLPVMVSTNSVDNINERNIHNKFVKIHENNLYVAGFGGSIDAYLYENKEKVEWLGFPYTDEQYGKGLGHLMEAWDRIKKNEDNSLILLTHIGPAWISTTSKNCKPYNDNERIQSGSEAAYELMKSYKYQEINKPLLWIHGHTHAGKGMTDFGSIPILNPGGLCYGQFSILSLKYTDDNKWKIENIEFHNL